MKLGLGASTIVIVGLLLCASASADEALRLTIKDHHYVPSMLAVPAGVKFKLLVRNEDATAEEFESFELNREKIVPPGEEVPVFLGPLDPGHYPFFGDFNPKTAQGELIVK